MYHSFKQLLRCPLVIHQVYASGHFGISDMAQSIVLESTIKASRGSSWSPFRVSEARRAEFRKGRKDGPLEAANRPIRV